MCLLRRRVWDHAAIYFAWLFTFQKCGKAKKNWRFLVRKRVFNWFINYLVTEYWYFLLVGVNWVKKPNVLAYLGSGCKTRNSNKGYWENIVPLPLTFCINANLLPAVHDKGKIKIINISIRRTELMNVDNQTHRPWKPHNWQNTLSSTLEKWNLLL